MQDAKAFTLIETTVVVVIVAILAGLAIPSLQLFFERSRISSAINALQLNLKYARSEAIKTNNDVYVKFSNGETWCYALADTTGCNCAETDSGQATYCSLNGVNISKSSDDYEGVTVSQLFTSNEIKFEKLYGTVTSGLTGSSGTITISTTDYSAEITVHATGLITVCSNSTVIGNYPACT